jgi:hypothetical protein
MGHTFNNNNNNNNRFLLPSVAAIQNKLMLKRLSKRVQDLEKIMFEAHTIRLEGIDYLSGIPGQHWTSRIYTLFTHANLPHTYILTMATSDTINDLPKTVDITLITYRVKLHTYYTLLHYFTEHRKDINIYKN